MIRQGLKVIQQSLALKQKQTDTGKVKTRIIQENSLNPDSSIKSEMASMPKETNIRTQVQKSRFES